MSVCLPLCAYLSYSLPVCLSVGLSVYLSVGLSVSRSVRPSVYVVRGLVYLSIYFLISYVALRKIHNINNVSFNVTRGWRLFHNEELRNICISFHTLLR